MSPEMKSEEFVWMALALKTFRHAPYAFPWQLTLPQKLFLLAEAITALARDIITPRDGKFRLRQKILLPGAPIDATTKTSPARQGNHSFRNGYY
jgi:hypothetical protein